MSPYVALAALTMTSLVPSVSFITWDADTPIQIDTYYVTTNYPMTFGVAKYSGGNAASGGHMKGRFVIDGKPAGPGSVLHCGSVAEFRVTEVVGHPQPASVWFEIAGNGIRCPEPPTP